MEIRKGTLADTDDFIALMAFVREGMERKDFLYLDPPEFVRQQMELGTMQLWVAKEGDTLAGAFSAIVPGLREDNYGYDLGFSREELLRVVNMDTAVVHPNYRGRGLQKRLMELAQEELSRAGDRILLCTIHPENSFSLENVRKQGYTVRKYLEKYGSVRYILGKELPGQKKEEI